MARRGDLPGRLGNFQLAGIEGRNTILVDIEDLERRVLNLERLNSVETRLRAVEIKLDAIIGELARSAIELKAEISDTEDRTRAQIGMMWSSLLDMEKRLIEAIAKR